MGRSADNFMFRADDCDENMAREGHAASPLLLEGIYGFMQRTTMRSPEHTVVWREDNAEGPKSFMGY